MQMKGHKDEGRCRKCSKEVKQGVKVLAEEESKAVPNAEAG